MQHTCVSGLLNFEVLHAASSKSTAHLCDKYSGKSDNGMA